MTTKGWPSRRTQIVWWFPQWCGVRFDRENGLYTWMWCWSLSLGFVELRRWRPWDEALAMFRAKK